MSIYSGFGLRKIEEQYNKLVAKLILLLQSDVLELMSPHQKDRRIQYGMQRKILGKYKEVFQKLEIFEEHRYLETKFSHLCIPLKNLISKKTSKLSIQSTKNQRKSKSERKTTQNPFNEQFSQFQSQDDNIKSITQSPNFRSENSKERYHLTLGQICNKKFQSKLHHQFNKVKINNEPLKIFTIQEVSENVSRKDSMKKNNKLIEIPTDRLDFEFKQKKIRIYKNNSKYKNISEPQHNNDEPFFPSYRKLSGQNINDQHTEQKRDSFQEYRNLTSYQENQPETSSLQRIPNMTVNFTMNQTFLSSQFQSIHKMKSFNVMQQQKPVKKVQKSSQFIKMRYKKLVDRANFQKLYVKKKT